MGLGFFGLVSDLFSERLGFTCLEICFSVFCLFGGLFRVDLGFMLYMMFLRVYLQYEKQKKSRAKRRSK